MKWFIYRKLSVNPTIIKYKCKYQRHSIYFKFHALRVIKAYSVVGARKENIILEKKICFQVSLTKVLVNCCCFLRTPELMSRIQGPVQPHRLWLCLPETLNHRPTQFLLPPFLSSQMGNHTQQNTRSSAANLNIYSIKTILKTLLTSVWHKPRVLWYVYRTRENILTLCHQNKS